METSDFDNHFNKTVSMAKGWMLFIGAIWLAVIGTGIWGVIELVKYATS